jgi:hypothetical protein
MRAPPLCYQFFVANYQAGCLTTPPPADPQRSRHPALGRGRAEHFPAAASPPRRRRMVNTISICLLGGAAVCFGLSRLIECESRAKSAIGGVGVRFSCSVGRPRLGPRLWIRTVMVMSIWEEEAVQTKVFLEAVEAEANLRGGPRPSWHPIMAGWIGAVIDSSLSPAPISPQLKAASNSSWNRSPGSRRAGSWRIFLRAFSASVRY